MSLIEYLSSLEEELNYYVICVNANCDAFREAREGILNLKEIENTVFFREYAKKLLNNKKAIELLNGAKYIGASSENEEGDKDNVLFVTCDVDDNYMNKRRKMQEILRG